MRLLPQVKAEGNRQESPMTNPGTQHMKDGGQRCHRRGDNLPESAATVQASPHAASGQSPLAAGRRRRRRRHGSAQSTESTRLRAVVLLGDTEALRRLWERTEDAATRPAGSTALAGRDHTAGPHTRIRSRARRRVACM